MKKFLLLTLLSWFCTQFTLHAQTVEQFNLFGTTVSNLPIPAETTQGLKSVARFELSRQELDRLLVRRPQNIRMELPSEQGNFQLDLHRVELLSPDFVMVSANGNTPVGLQQGVFYQGQVLGEETSTVALSCFGDQVMGNLLIAEKAYSLGPKSTANRLIHGLDMEVPQSSPLSLEAFSCQTQDEVNEHLLEEMAHVNHSVPEAPAALVSKMVNIHFECDFDMYVKMGSNPQTLLNYVTSLFNVVHTLYRNESVLTRIKSIRYWTTTDPYADRTNTFDALVDFGNEMRNAIPNGANLAHLLSTRSLGGGIAWLDVACLTPYYSSGNGTWVGPFAVSAINTSFNQFPTYSWSVMVVAHEMGHNLGSPHTQSCSWSGGAIDNCYTPEGSCPPGPAPTNGGTIMSYCHLTNNGINFNNGFGIQPGNLIRNRVAAGTCLSTTSDATLTLSTNNVSAANTNGSYAVDISTSPNTLYWAATENVNWITLSQTAGTGNASLSITLTANTGSSSRSATITIAAENLIQTITVVQAGSNGSFLNLSPENSNVLNTATSLSIALTSNINWAVVSNANWITPSPSAGSNNATLTLNIQANSGAARTGTVTVSGDGQSKTVTINQAADPGLNALSVSPTAPQVGSSSGSFAVTVTANVAWTVSSNANWLTANPTSGSNNGTVTASYTTNTAISTRTGVLTFSGGGITRTVTVTQAAAAASLTISPTTVNAGSGASSFALTISSNTSWTVSSNANWLSSNSSSGSGNSSATISYTANSGAARTGTISVTGGGITRTLTVNQSAGSNTLSVSPTTSSPTAAAGTLTITLSANVAWSVASNANWLTASPTSGSNNSAVTATYTANTGAARTGVLTFTGGGLTATVTVNQSAGNANLTLNPTTVSPSNAAGSQNVAVTANVAWSVSSNAAWLTFSPSSGTNNGNITANYALNTGGSRTGILTVTGGGLTRTVVVNQEGATPQLSITPTASTPTNSAGSINVSVVGNVSWTVSSDANWLTANPTSGSNNGAVSASYSANTGSTARTGILTFSGGGITRTLTVTQAAANSLTVDPSSLSPSSSSGSSNIAVSSNVSWTVSSNASWLTRSPTSGSNNGTVVASYSTNTGSTSRTGTLTFNGGGITRTVTVTQAPPANLTVSPTSLTPASAAGSSSITVSSNVSWTLSSNASWLTTNTASGTNNATVSASYTENTGSTARTGTLTFSGGGITRTVTVTQGAPVNLTLTPSTLTPSSSSGSSNIAVSSNVSWTVSSNVSWLTRSPTSGSNNGTVVASYTTNTGSTSRTGTLTFSGGGITRTVTVTQAPPANLTVSPTSLTPASAAGSSSITVSSNVNWTLSSNADWLTTNATNGTNNATVSASYTENTGNTSRTGTLTFSGGGITRTVTVTQGAPVNLTLTPSTLTPSSSSGSSNIAVSSNVSWTVSSNVSWLTRSPTSGSNNGTVVASYTTNTGSTSRTGTLTFSGGGITRTVTVTQAPPANLTVSPTSLTPASAAGSSSITVSSNVSWTVSSNADWLTTNATNGTNNATVSASYTENTGNTSRTGTLTFSGGGITRTVTVTQAGVTANSLTITPSNLQITNVAGSANLAVNANVSWTVTSNAAWLTTTPTAGNNNGTVSTRYTANTGSQRVGTLTFSGGGLTRTVTITQAGAASCATPPSSQLWLSNLTETSVTFNCLMEEGVQNFGWRYRLIGTGSWRTLSNTTINLQNATGLSAGGIYEFQCRLFCTSTGSWTSWSTAVQFIVPVEPPGDCNAIALSQLSTSNLSSSTARLAVSGVVSNRFRWRYRKINTTGWSAVQQTTNNVVEVTGLSSSSTYEFQAQYLCTEYSYSLWSTSATFTTSGAVVEPCPTATVNQLSASNVTENQARLNTSLTGASSLGWRYRILGAGQWINTAVVAGTFMDIGNLSSNTTYEYQVQGVCSESNVGNWSPSATFTTLSPQCPTPSANQLAAINVSTSGATLTVALSGHTGYNWRYRSLNSVNWQTVNNVAASHPLSNLTPGTTYEYQAQVNCGNTQGAWSPSTTFSTQSIQQACNPLTESDMSASNITATGAQLNANASNVLGINWRYRPVSGNTWTTNSGNSNLSMVLSGLLSTTTYEFQTQVVCSGNTTSAWSNSKTFATLAPAATCSTPQRSNLSVNNFQGNRVTFNCDLTSGVSRYWWRYRLLATAQWTTLASTITNSTVVSGFEPGGIYEMQVRLTCSATGAQTSWSSTYSFVMPDEAVQPPVSGLNHSPLSDKVTLTAYPNPTGGTGWVDLLGGHGEKATLRLLDTRGVLIMEREIEVHAAQTEYLDLSQYSAGWYILQLTSQEYQLVQRWLKQ